MGSSHLMSITAQQSISINELRHQLRSSVVFLHTVDVVTEVDGHDAAGVVSVHAQLRMVKGTYFNTYLGTQQQRLRRTCLGLSLCVKSRVWSAKFLACRTKHSASWLSCRSTCQGAGKKPQSLEQMEILTSQMCIVLDLLRWKVKKVRGTFGA